MFERGAAARRLVASVLPLVHEAGNPYYDWFFGDASAARSALRAWIARPSSEISIERVVVARVRRRLVGAYVALGGTELRHARDADALALLARASSEPTQRARLVERLAVAKSLFAPVAPEDWYLSKIAVVPRFRGQGIGRAIVDEYLSEGFAAGFRRFRLDVSAENDHAVQIYKSLGFVVETEGSAAGLRYLAMILDAR
jgi:ribosomal protein S18 acetylase RimI-like enzyme